MIAMILTLINLCLCHHQQLFEEIEPENARGIINEIHLANLTQYESLWDEIRDTSAISTFVRLQQEVLHSSDDEIIKEIETPTNPQSSPAEEKFIGYPQDAEIWRENREETIRYLNTNTNIKNDSAKLRKTGDKMDPNATIFEPHCERVTPQQSAVLDPIPELHDNENDGHELRLSQINISNVSMDNVHSHPRTQSTVSFMSMSQIVAYQDSKTAGGTKRWFCPFDGLFTEFECTKSSSNPSFNGWKSSGSLHNHIKTKHIANKDPIPQEYYTKHRKSWCEGCQKLYAISNKDKHVDHDNAIGDEADNNEEVAVNYSLAEQLKFVENISMDEIFKYKINQVQSIPAALHRQWIDVIDDMLELLRTNSNETNWKLFNMMPKVIWHTPLRSGKKRAAKKKEAWSRRMNLWRDEKYMDLWTEFMAEWEIQNISKQRAADNNRLDPNDVDYYTKLERRRAKSGIYFARNGDLSGGARAMTSYGMMDLNESAVKQLQKLHPPEDELKCDVADYIDNDQLQLKHNTLLSAIKRFKRTTSEGLDGWRPIYWKPIVGDYKQQRTLIKLTEIANAILSGAIHTEIKPWFGDCSGTLLAKDVTKEKGRPIAAGLGLRRLITKGIVIEILNDTNDILFPLQIGAAKNGCELAIHSIRRAMKHYENDPELSFLSVDERNAFNSVYRHKIRVAVLMFTPQIIVMWDLIYACHSKIWYTDSIVIMSQRGYQQGDGLASFGFGIVIFMVFKNDQVLLQVALMIWYHDDGGFICNIHKMDEILNIINDRSRELGLELNSDKTTIYTNYMDAVINFDCVIEYNLDIPLLGSIIGSPKATEAFLDKKLDEIKLFFNTLSFINDPQIVGSYLYYCTNYGKVMHLLRTIPPDYIASFCVEYDNMLREKFEHVIESPTTDLSFEQISIGISSGGIGLRASKHHNLAAYLSSTNQSDEAVQNILVNKAKYAIYDDTQYVRLTQDEYEATMSDVRAMEHVVIDEFNIEKETLKDQKTLSELIDKKRFENLFAKSDIANKARLNACRAPSAAAWLTAIPTYGNILQPKEFKIAMRMWCGVPLYKDTRKGKCRVCGAICDYLGWHFIHCKQTNNGVAYGHTKKHNYIRNWIYGQMRMAYYEPELEKSGIAIGVGKERPADVYVPLWNHGVAAAIDIGITSPLKGDILVSASKEILATATAYENHKLDTYLPITNPMELKYVPFILESYGGMTDKTIGVLKKICYDLRGKTKQQFSHLVNLKRKQLSLKLWKCNAKMVLDRLPFNL